MQLKDYLNHLWSIMDISKYPINEINTYIGFLRFHDIWLYEPCLQYVKEKLLRKRFYNNFYNRQDLKDRKKLIN